MNLNQVIIMFRSSVSSILLVFIFFHAVGGIPNIDVQPTFFIFSTLIISIFCFQLKFNFNDFILCLICLISITFAYTLQLEYLTFKYSVTYIICILMAWYMIVLIRNGYIKELAPKTIYWIIGVYATVGFIQFFIPDFMSFLVTRSEEAALSFSSTGRGVRSLTGEPAHLGKIFSLLNILLIFLYINVRITHDIKKKLICITIFLFLVNTTISRSAYAILFHSFIVAFLLFFLYRKFFYFFMILLLISGVLFISILLNVESDIRFIKLFIAVFNNSEYLLEQGAIKRLFNIPMILNNLSYYDWYGAGMSPNSEMSSIPSPFGRFEYLVHNRGYGGYFEYVLKFGVFSIPITLIVFHFLNEIRKIVVTINGKNYYLGYFFSITLFIFLFQDGTPVNPLPLFILIYFYLNSNQLKIIKFR